MLKNYTILKLKPIDYRMREREREQGRIQFLPDPEGQKDRKP